MDMDTDMVTGTPVITAIIDMAMGIGGMAVDMVDIAEMITVMEMGGIVGMDMVMGIAGNFEKAF